ncbi:MAG: dihydroneopterin aldolase [Gammaproteobacteria bacterium]|nr:dihydroneopterin aldolase [Gammaproteobacteria bacterium]
MPVATLEVNHYETQVHLGWTEQERETPQKIALDISLRFHQLPSACLSDELEDTQCYAQLIDIADKICQSAAFKLLEHLACKIYEAIKQQLNNPSITVSVRVHKLNPPVSHLKEASFTVSDAL